MSGRPNRGREWLADVLMSDRVMRAPGMGRDYALVEADAIIAYLLTDAVAERAAYAMYLDRPIELDQDGGDDWGILPDEWKFEWIEGARAALEGALGVHALGSADPVR